jgi:hypothetical protein
MSWLTKAVGNTKKWVNKASGSVQAFSHKAAGVIHDVNSTFDKFAGSTVGKALLDAIPEGHLIYDAVRSSTGLAEKGFKGAETLAGGVKGLSKSKSLKQALTDGKKLFASTKAEASTLEKQRRGISIPSSIRSRFKMS